MNNSENLNNKKENYAKNLNTSHSNVESKRLETNVRTYNNNLRNRNLSKNNLPLQNNNYQNSSNQHNSAFQRINSARQKNAYGNSLATNKAASAGLSAVGVPKPLSDKIVNSKLGQKAIDKTKKQIPALNMLDRMMGGKREQMEDYPSGNGGVNFQLSMKFVKIATISFAPVFLIVIFCCLFISASQVYSKSIGLGNADKVNTSDEDFEKQINGTSQEDLNQETKDDDVASLGSVSKFMMTKLNSANLVLDNTSSVVKERPFNEADLSELDDYYSLAIDFAKKYNMQMVYTFYFKLHYIQKHYQNNYHVYLDMPLIMATLNVQSSDMGDIFSSNIIDYDVNSKTNNPYFSYDYDWTTYVTTKDNSSHDIEVLAQNMVTETRELVCDEPVIKFDEEGNEYKVCYIIDEEKYRNFLPEFLEKKYYLNDSPLSGSSTGSSNNNGNNNNNPTQQTGDWRNWKQCGQSWSNNLVPSSKSNMCSIGCAVTAVTIQIAKSGTYTVVKPIDPGRALNFYDFQSGGNLYWGSVSKLAPNFNFVAKVSLEGMSKAAVAKKLSSYDSSRYYILLNVGKHSARSAHHYVALDYVNTSTNNLYMIDPGSSASNDLYSTYKVYKAVIYEKKD